MINNERVGVGIITCNRSQSFKTCYNSIPNGIIDNGVVVNDGNRLDFVNNKHFDIIEHAGNLGVGVSKNDALKTLIEYECDHIFLIEDDIFIKDSTVFEKYINSSKTSGIQHFNYSQHGLMNKTIPDGVPNPRYIIDYGSLRIPFYTHCVGAFSYYSKQCLETVGILDENYYNACEHVDHTYMIIKSGMHPPFWSFADIENSWDYLGDEGWSVEQSLISSSPNHSKVILEADKVFRNKHGLVPFQIPLVSESEFGNSVKNIKKIYGSDSINNVL